MAQRRTAHAEMYLTSAQLTQLDHAGANRRAAHDGVVDDADARFFDHGTHRVQLHADAEIAHGLGG